MTRKANLTFIGVGIFGFLTVTVCSVWPAFGKWLIEAGYPYVSAQAYIGIMAIIAFASFISLVFLGLAPRFLTTLYRNSVSYSGTNADRQNYLDVHNTLLAMGLLLDDSPLHRSNEAKK